MGKGAPARESQMGTWLVSPAVCRKLARPLTTETPFKEVDVPDRQQNNPFISLTSNPRHDKIDDQL